MVLWCYGDITMVILWWCNYGTRLLLMIMSLQGCLKTNPEERLTIDQVIRNQWIAVRLMRRKDSVQDWRHLLISAIQRGAPDSSPHQRRPEGGDGAVAWRPARNVSGSEGDASGPGVCLVVKLLQTDTLVWVKYSSKLFKTFIHTIPIKQIADGRQLEIIWLSQLNWFCGRALADLI